MTDKQEYIEQYLEKLCAFMWIILLQKKGAFNRKRWWPAKKATSLRIIVEVQKSEQIPDVRRLYLKKKK